jgi:hypothetical protein
MKKLFIATLSALMMLCAQSASAWGGWAHNFITYTAEKHLEPGVKEKVEKYLGSPMIDHCRWMDQIRKPVRNKKHPQHQYHMAWAHTLAWHMITVDKNLELSNERAYNNDGDLLPNVKVCIENLKNHRNLTDSAVMVNLKCVIHMMEDMHCPCHIYYTEFPDCFRKPGVKYRWDLFPLEYEGAPSTNHKVWDGLSILELYPQFNEDYEKFRVKLDNLSPKKQKKICEGSVDDWALETARDCRVIYDWIKPNDKLTRDFLLKHRKLTIQQYHRAAYRLAHVLNETMK